MFQIATILAKIRFTSDPAGLGPFLTTLPEATGESIPSHPNKESSYASNRSNAQENHREEYEIKKSTNENSNPNRVSIKATPETANLESLDAPQQQHQETKPIPRLRPSEDNNKEPTDWERRHRHPRMSATEMKNPFDRQANQIVGEPEYWYARQRKARGGIPNAGDLMSITTQATLSVPGHGLSDEDVSAIARCLSVVRGKAEHQHAQIMNEIDVSNNNFSSRGLKPLLDVLPMFGMNILKLNFSNNSIGTGCLFRLCELLEFDLPCVREIDLSGVLLHESEGICSRLAAALADHSAMKKINLSNTGLGKSSQKQCIEVAAIIKKSNVTHLDLSYNLFMTEGFKALGDALGDTDTLEELSLAYNAARVETNKACDQISQLQSLKQSPEEPPYSAIMGFFQGLRNNRTLRALDFSACGINANAGLVLEEALICMAACKRQAGCAIPFIRKLNLNDNPLGDKGMGAMLRAWIGRDDCVDHVIFESIRPSPPSSDSLSYDFGAPSASYTLNMEFPYHQALVSHLARRCDDNRVARDTAFQQFKLNGRPISVPGPQAKGLNGPLPDAGELFLVFKMPKPRDDRLTEYRRIDAGNRISLLERAFKNLGSSAPQQHRMLADAAADLFSLRSATIQRLGMLTCEPGYVCRRLSIGLTTQKERVKTAVYLHKQRKLDVKHFQCADADSMDLNVECPDGRWFFDTTDPIHLSMLTKLQLLNCFHIAQSKAKGIDVSRSGDFSAIRNCVVRAPGFVRAASEAATAVAAGATTMTTAAGDAILKDGSYSHAIPIISDELPTRTGTVQLDYSQPTSVHPSSVPVSDAALDRLISALTAEDRFTVFMKLTSLRVVAHRLVLRASQFRDIVLLHGDPYWRMETFVMLYKR